LQVEADLEGRHVGDRCEHQRSLRLEFAPGARDREPLPEGIDRRLPFRSLERRSHRLAEAAIVFAGELVRDPAGRLRLPEAREDLEVEL
jgi:hypothetical protein